MHDVIHRALKRAQERMTMDAIDWIKMGECGKYNGTFLISGATSCG
jgi:hypothetical protein